ncbi:YadA-like family protein [Acinetobacter bereziniae]|uniref:YadA-like family protein n=1 Tax=Acinetobacter bereziniae TaxID=106648 RepID=UPI0019023980|nr:YadA-like family protein [Acinetobacter bereziniae]MBJ8554235.1 YadA-like family protein [Acinetobacter bereziniae]
MNHVYRLLWNSSLGAWIAVSELAKSAGKKTSTKISASVCALVVSGMIVFPTNSNAYSVASADPCANLSDTRVGIGLNAKACSNDAIAIGQSAQAVNFGSIAIGRESYAESTVINGVGYPSVAVGYKASAIGQDASAFGNNAKANVSFTTAVGNFANASSRNALAVGNSTSATGVAASAIGNFASATGLNSIALGGGGVPGNFQGAQATADGATAIGGNSSKGAVASGENSTAISGEATASGTSAIAIGTESNASGESGIAIGTGAQANAKDTISIGTGNIVTGQGSGAIGDPTTINGTGTYSIGNNNGTIDAHESGVFGNDNTINGELVGVRVVGNTNTVSNDYAMVMGNENTASSFNAAILGNDNTVSGEGSLAIGRTNVVSGTRAIGIGANSEATADQSISIGHLTSATGQGATAVGWDSSASNIESTALGVAANASGERSSALGTASTATGSSSIAVGTGALSSGTLSSAIGTLSFALGARSVALGAAIANKDNSVALGALSDTNTNATQQISATLNGLTYGDFAGQVTDVGMQVSIGAVGRERQIKNVGSGEISSVSTDAINGSQLHATNSVLGNLGNSIETTLGGNAVLNPNGSISTTNIGNTSQNTVHDAILASQEEVAGGTNVANVTSTTGTNGQTIYTVNADGASVSAGSSAVNVVAGVKDANNVTDYAVDLSQTTKDSLVKADTALQSVVTQIDGVDVKTVDQNDNKVNFVSGNNVELTANADGSINVGTAADVNFNTVNTTDLTVTGTTQLGNSFTVNNGGSYYTGPITDGNHITNKTYVDQTAAASKTEVAGGTNVANVTSTTGTNGQTIYTVNADGASVSAGSSAVNVVAGVKDANNVTDYAVDLSQTTKDSLVKADTALQSVVTQIDGVDVKTVDQNDNKVNFVSGNNVELTANADGSINVGTAADVNFNTVNTTDLTVTGTTQLGNSFTVNNGGSYYTGPITDGNHITNKTYVDQTAAASKTEVAGGTNVANVTSTTGTNGQTIYTVNADGASVSAGSSAVNVVAGVKDANNVTDYAVDLSQTTKDSLVKADTALQSVVTQIDGVDVKTVDQNDNKVNFVSGNNVELTANADGSINVGTAADVNFNTVNTTDLTVTGTTQLGNSFTVNNGGSYYTGPITDGNHITNKTYVDQTAAASKTEIEEGKNIKVTSTTGVDGQTVYTLATADEVDFDKVTVGDTAISTDGVVIANGPSLTKDGISAGAKKVTDVADGMISTDSKDAINGSQLHAIGNNVTQLFGGNATYVNNQISWNNIGGTGQNTIDDAIKHVNNQVINANKGWNVSTDSGSNATSTVKPGQTVKINGNSDNGVLVTNSGNEIKVSLSDQIKIGSGDNTVSIDGNAGTIKAGSVLIDGSKGNISAGKVNINGEAGTVNGLTNTTWNPNNIVTGQAATEDQLLQVAKNATAAATAAKTTVTAGENITVSSSKNSDGSTNYQVATNKDVKFDTVTSGSITTDKISVGNVTIDQSGINAGGSKVTNLSNGTVSSTSKDAINGSQLHASNTNIYNYLGGGANYETNTGPTYNVGGGSYNNVGDALNSLDQKVTNVTNQLEEAFYTTNKRIDDVENRANAGNAQALATAGLPQAYIPGKSMMAISGGTYRGETGYAIGMSSISDNGKWVFKVSGSGNSRGDFGGTVGAGIQW